MALYTIKETGKQVTLQELADYYAIKNKVPKNLFRALINAESSWNYKAISPAGAIGLTQGMPSTIKGMGYNVETFKNNVYLQLEFGAKYIAMMFKATNRWDYALAAYNAGIATVQKYKGIPPYKETIAYVNRVMKEAGEIVEEEEESILIPKQSLRSILYSIQNINKQLEIIMKGGK